MDGNTVEDDEDSRNRMGYLSDGTKAVYCICRRGVALVKVTRILVDHSPRRRWVVIVIMDRSKTERFTQYIILLVVIVHGRGKLILRSHHTK